VLLEKPGAVHHKRALLERVWGDGESDEHVVEVTVGRLRQRLGSAGAGIETVIKRGYRLSAEP
jgi:uroporphyrinogen-III synthase